MMSSRITHIARRAALIVGLVAVVAVLGFGWHMGQAVQITTVQVSGAVHADIDRILELAAVPDSTRLFELDPRLVADRVAREPWVRSARVTRWLSGTLAISIQERVPAALAINPAGQAVAYLDAEGHVMPLTTSALQTGFDVPLLTGRLPRLVEAQRVEDGGLRRLLAALPGTDTFTDALISGIERRPDGEFVLITAPTPEGIALPVRLGRDGFEQKLRRLEAFWEQVILAEPGSAIRRIDLRFDGQVVTADRL
jgi:cell division protein FtsQ